MRNLNLLNKVLIVLSSIVNIVCIVLTHLGILECNILVCISFYFLLILPIVIRRIKLKFSASLELVYLLFIILSCLLGSILKFYGMIYWFDSFVHYISGMLTALLAFVLLIYINKYKERDLAFHIVFMILTTLSVAAFWEIFEFAADALFGGDAQKVLLTGVTDTMKDIICALLGSILVSIMYAYEDLNNKKILVKKFIESMK